MRLTLTLHANTIGWIEYIQTGYAYAELSWIFTCKALLTNSFESLLQIIRYLTLNSITISNLLEKRRRGWGWGTGSTYHICSIRCRAFFSFYRCSFCVATIRGQRLILIARRHQQWLDKVHMSNTVVTDAVSSTHSPPVLVSATERSCTTLTALALARWPSSEIIAHLCMYV